MNDLIIWLMGDTLGKKIINTWDWLWQMPTEPPTTVKSTDEIALEHATQLLISIAAKVTEMERAVDRVRSISQEIERQYNQKSQEHQNLVSKAFELQRSGNIVEARLSMARSIGIERILPELKVRLDRAQEMLINANDYHTQEQSKLTLLEIEFQSLAASMAMNKSMGGDRELAKFNDLNNLQEKFRNVQAEAEDRYQQIKIMSQLSHSTDCVLEETLTIDEIDRRIRSLGS
ncbi:hypothetical protein [Chamaesiphon sp. VAR_48_metabat_403]|uniref:PspA/IM30 family protein n=1 Tax=Chamaesiphon sp. VAR_48_metabat_403 TaxID=2964700 RepID=UPI00286DF071|nr:hypothetical protein [Chamaesiphon sp. VAR_48_metabat_403]